MAQRRVRGPLAGRHDFGRVSTRALCRRTDKLDLNGTTRGRTLSPPETKARLLDALFDHERTPAIIAPPNTPAIDQRE